MPNDEKVNNTPIAVIILAAGQGSRMKSDMPKATHKIAGRPMIGWLVETLEGLDAQSIITVISPQGAAVAEAVKPHETVIQRIPQGTGDAVKPALDLLHDFTGDVLIMLADMPMISADTIAALITARHEGGKTAMSVLGANFEAPPAYGRLVLGKDGTLERIVEDKDASAAEKAIQLCNIGAFCVDSDYLAPWVSALKNDNAQKEYYVTDLVQIARENSFNVRVHVTEDHHEIFGINSRAELAAMEGRVQHKLREKAMANGVTLIDPASVTFAHDTQIGRDCVIEPNVFFGENVKIGSGTIIHAFSHIEGARIGNNAAIGPFARIRPHSVLEDEVTAGNFIEVNRSHMKKGSKAKHVSYLGDTIVGAKTNIGAGTVVANYDGFAKQQTVFGDNVFIGSNSTIIAPTTIGAGAVVAAGTTLKGDIAADALAIARPQTDIREGWAAERRKRKGK